MPSRRGKSGERGFGGSLPRYLKGLSVSQGRITPILKAALRIRDGPLRTRSCRQVIHLTENSPTDPEIARVVLSEEIYLPEKMTVDPQRPLSPSSDFASRVLEGLLRASWTIVRMPLLTVLVILEPVVRVLLAACALLLVLAALFFECLAPHTSIPFWGMLAVAVGCVALLALYYTLLRVFSA
jgi:hypothetical protein